MRFMRSSTERGVKSAFLLSYENSEVVSIDVDSDMVSINVEIGDCGKLA